MSRTPPLFAALLVAALAAVPALAQDTPPSEHFDLTHDSGTVSNPGPNEAVVISFPVSVDGAHWMRLEFSEVLLSGSVLAGDGAKLRITSYLDGAVQELNALHVEQWRRTSAYFNGDTVLVEVVAQPHTGANRVVLSGVTADITGATPESICGATDDRVLSSDPRAGRLLPIGCTGWLINDCGSCALTAGHCTSNITVLQFNVPLSQANGTIVNPPPQDQYSIDQTSIQSNGGQGTGNDWGYFGTFANSTSGLTAFQAQGARYTLVVPPAFNGSHTIRITGFGTDSSPSTSNQVQQTHVGPWVTSSGSLVQYATDTTGGNSGSPVIHEPTGNAIGIHTHGGCSSSGGQNSGTGANHAGLQAALAAPTGICSGGGLSVVGNLPTQMQAGVAVQVSVQVAGGFVPGTVELHYSYDGGAFIAQTMTAGGGGVHSGTLPAPACGDSPRFFFSVQHSTCGTLTNPSNAPTGFYSATVSGAEVGLFADNFQTNQGWTTSINGATTGQWERGIPVNDAGWAYDPLADGDGSGQCYLTQNAAGNTDVDGGSVTLTSPAFDLEGGECLVRYRYYLNLTVTDGADRLLVEMSASGAAGPWATVATHSASNGTSWTSHEIDAGDVAAAGLAFTNDMRVRFTANDGGGASIVEAGVDGVAVVRSACSLIQSYCVSGGLGSAISATGGSSIAANNLVLHANNIPANKFGLFFYGSGKQSTPFGNGTRCVAAPSFRLPLLNSGAGNTLDFAVNYGALPPGGAILAGDLWNFQCWFRDGVGPFDLSNALQVIFVP